MNKIILLAGSLLVVGSVTLYSLKEAPAVVLEKKTITIGILSSQANASYEGMIQQVKETVGRAAEGYTLVYLQEQNLTNETFDAAAKKYVEQKVDIIFANSTPAVVSAKKYTTSTPIIFGSTGDPVGSKVVASMDSSGNNTTGVTSLAVDLTPRRLEILVNTFPDIRRVYFIYEPGAVTSEASKLKAESKAKELGVTLVLKEVRTAVDVKVIAEGLRKKEADAIIMAASAMVWGQVSFLAEAQNREKIPLIGTDRTMIQSGTILTYGPDYTVMGTQVGEIIAAVIRGTKPTDIPIQSAKKIEFILNTKVMDAVGLQATDEAISAADLLIR